MDMRNHEILHYIRKIPNLCGFSGLVDSGLPDVEIATN